MMRLFLPPFSRILRRRCVKIYQVQSQCSKTTYQVHFRKKLSNEISKKYLHSQILKHPSLYAYEKKFTPNMFYFIKSFSSVPNPSQNEFDTCKENKDLNKKNNVKIDTITTVSYHTEPPSAKDTDNKKMSVNISKSKAQDNNELLIEKNSTNNNLIENKNFLQNDKQEPNNLKQGKSDSTRKEKITESADIIEGRLRSKELKSGVQRYFFSRYFSYLTRFQHSLENEMPDTFQMFRIFSSGLKEFIIDFKDYIGVLLHLSLPGERMSSLNRRKLELYHNMPGDMIRVFPVLAVSSIPFGQNVAFPIAYYVPEYLLCRHFWRPEQMTEFSEKRLKYRLYNARPVFRWLQEYFDEIKDETLRDQCEDVFFKLGSGIHPSSEEIIQLLPLFHDGPFSLFDIRGNHLNALLRFHGRSAFPPRKIRLKDHANYLHLLDKAIYNENINTLNHEKLKEHLFIRGINPKGLSHGKMIDTLTDWVQISLQLRKESLSLLLHLPILMAYNHPSNLSLIN